LLGVDYVEHIILPGDTLQGICLAYKISATRLRQANQFSGNSLSLAPKKLIIPLSKKALRTGFVKVQDKASREYKVHAFLAEMPNLNLAAAEGYLELSDWVVENAIQSAREDGEWETNVQTEQRGEATLTVQVKEGLPVDVRSTSGKSSSSRPTRFSDLPAIANKDVRPQDVYNAAPQHNGFGVELQELS